MRSLAHLPVVKVDSVDRHLRHVRSLFHVSQCLQPPQDLHLFLFVQHRSWIVRHRCCTACVSSRIPVPLLGLPLGRGSCVRDLAWQTSFHVQSASADPGSYSISGATSRIESSWACSPGRIAGPPAMKMPTGRWVPVGCGRGTTAASDERIENSPPSVSSSVRSGATCEIWSREHFLAPPHCRDHRLAVARIDQRRLVPGLCAS